MKSATAVRRLPARTILLFAFAATLLFALLAPASAFAQSPTPSESPSATESPLTDARPTLGILGLSAPDGRGVTVARVVPNSGADDAGLEAGDLITDIEGKKMAAIEDLTSAIGGFKVGDTITLTYERDGQSQTSEVELGSSRANRDPNPFRIPEFEPRFPEDAPNAPREPDLPGNPDRPNLRTSPVNDTDYRPVIILFGLLITAALVTLIVLQLRKNRPATETVQTSAYVPPAAATHSNPLDVLKMRYAKGEITRDEYLTMSSDLNGAGAPGSESPTQEL
jgi:membrane-associated protease RseP (regulator of RpoE activity)